MNESKHRHCLIFEIDCQYAQKCMHCLADNKCKGRARCGNHINCFGCKLPSMNHDEILPCEVASVTARAVTQAHIRLMQCCIALDYKNPKNGKYKVFKNYFSCPSANDLWEHLVNIGYAALDIKQNESCVPPKNYLYSLTRDGLDFMGVITGCKITEGD